MTPDRGVSPTSPTSRFPGLKELLLPFRLGIGGPLAIRFSIANDGWAAPFNPRSFEVIRAPRQLVEVSLHP